MLILPRKFCGLCDVFDVRIVLHVSGCSYRCTPPPIPHQQRQPAYNVATGSRDAAAYKRPHNTDAETDNYCDCESELAELLMTFI